MNQTLYLDGQVDRLFAGTNYPLPFAFNTEVAEVFDNMVSRSVPLYEQVIALAANWARACYKPGTLIYDLGCSTGTTLEFMARQWSEPASFVGIDSSEAMIAKASAKLANIPSHHMLRLETSDILDQEFLPCSVVIANYTLQFLPLPSRANLIQRIHEALVPGGVFFLSEKVLARSSDLQPTITRLYEEFKVDRGYTEDEVAKKREALQRVLQPETEASYLAMLEAAGFKACDSICKWHHFVTFVARKAPEPSH